MSYQISFPLKELCRRRGLSERRLAALTGLSRTCIRQIHAGDDSVTIRSVVRLAQFFDRSLQVLTPGQDSLLDYSTHAVGMKVERDGFVSWKIHFMDFVDEFRRSVDPQLVLFPPPHGLDVRLRALLASIVRVMCEELGLLIPAWARKRFFLPTPWFVSEMESLKASALVESPLPFRDNNIFVHENFLLRA